MASRNFLDDHGGINPQELKRLDIPPEQVIDFSVNSNPFGPSRRVLAAIQSVDISAYPDRDCAQLRAMLSVLNRVAGRNIIIGNGTTELIWLIARAFLKPDDKVVIAGPAFNEYRRASAINGADVIEVRAQSPLYTPPLDQIIAVIKQQAPRLIFLCNPNNPTGHYLHKEHIRHLIKMIPADSLIILDEAYKAFIDGSFFGEIPAENCILLRSMTKDFALAGLRVGYALASSSIIERLKQCQPAWSVNAIAQSAGCAVLEDLDYYRDTLSKLDELKNQFFSAIKAANYTMLKTDTHFGLIHTVIPAQELRLRLLHSGIQVRDCTSFGLPKYIRVSTRLPSENQKLVRALIKLKDSGKKE